MNGQDQPVDDGKVPMKDRVSGGYFRVPKTDVYDMSHYHHGQQVSENEYKAAVAKQQKGKKQPTAPSAPAPTQPTPAPPAKPSAALGPTGQPLSPVTIPGPGGVGTNTVTGPRAGPPPPVAGAGAGSPSPELPPNIQSTTPGGRQAMTQQQQAQPTANVMSDIASGLGKTVEQQAARMGAAFGAVAPSTAQRVATQPMSPVEQATKDTAEFMEWMAVPMGHGAIDAGTEALIKRFVPQITAKGVVSAQVLARILYNTALGAELGKAQGKDPTTSAILNGGLSLLLEPLAKLSPMMLAKFLGAETERNTSLAKLGEKAMAAAKYRPVFTRGQFADRAEKMYNQAVAETDRLSQSPISPGGQQQAGTSMRQMILDVQDAIDNGPVNQRGKLNKLNKELISASSTTDRNKLQSAIKEWRTQKALFKRNQRAWRTASPTMKPVYMEAMSVASEKSTRIRQEMENLPANITSEDLNQLRRTLSDIAPWGKRDIELDVAAKKTKEIYNKVANLEKQIVPGSARSIGDEDALHDLAMGASKHLGLTGYIHSLSSPASLATSGAALAGYHLGGHAFGGAFAGKMAGAVAGGALGVPTMTSAMRALQSRVMRGAAYGAAQQLSPDSPVPGADWSTKGKPTPYTTE